MNPALDIATATDIVVPTEKLRCSEPRYDPGGGGINVARAVQLLGAQARAIFPAGGMSGAMFCDLLKGEDVPHTFVPIAGITRESLAVVERQTGKQYRFLLPGPVLGHVRQGGGKPVSEEVAKGQAAIGGSLAGSASISGGVISAIPSICM
jgi:6-phosphofructokinase 2